MKSRNLIGALMLALIASLSACKKEEGRMEKAGKKLDKAAQDVEDSVKKAADEVEGVIEDKKDGD